MRLFMVVLLLAGLSGCASLQPNPDEWTDQERIAFGLNIVVHTADAVTTSQGIDRGCVEANPILGSNPNMGSVIAIKALVLGIQYAVYNSPNMGDNTHVFGYISAAIVGGIAIHNSQIDCY